MFTLPAGDGDTISKLATVLAHVQNSTYSSFYRDYYKQERVPLAISSVEEWQKIPFLERTRIKTYSLWDRVYVPREEVFAIRNTAGTSEGKPLFTARRTFGDYAITPKKAGVQRMLSFTLVWYMTELLRRTYGAITMNHEYPRTPGEYVHAARLAKKFRADSLFIFPSTAVHLAPHLKAEGVLQDIRVVELFGERCSPAQLEVLQQSYPNARFMQNYSASEWAGVFGLACTCAIATSSNSFHIVGDSFFCEFIDPDTGEPQDPREQPAELVLSSLTTDQPFPLIRYRTGDMLKVDLEHCDCEYATPRFKSCGRSQADRVRFLPGEFAITRIEAAVAQVSGVHKDEFEAHYEERQVSGAWKPYLRIYVVPETDHFDFDAAAVQLASTIPINSSQTYADGVRCGYLLPLVVERLTHASISRMGKRRRLIVHTENAQP